MVFFVYIVYELPFAFLGLATSGYYFHGFLCPHRLRAPVCFSRSDTQWLVSLAESAEDFHAFHRLHCL